MADLDGDNDEFAYFLPKGIEDDQDDFGRYDGLENSMDAGASGGEDGASASSYGSSSSATAAFTPVNWQTNNQQQANRMPSMPQQQQRENAQRQQFGASQGADSMLAQFYQTNGAPSNTSSSYYPQQSASSPSHSVGATSGLSSHAAAFTSNAPMTAADTAGLSSQQMQFFQQLQLYQQQLLLQQQQSAISGGNSHYTKAPTMGGLTYDNEPSTRPDNVLDQPQPVAAVASGTRRRPLPHHSHTSVTIMNRPPAEDASASGSEYVGRTETILRQPKTTTVTPVTTGVVDTTRTPPVDHHQHATPVAVVHPTGTWAGHAHAHSNGHSTYVKHIPTSVVASTKTEKWPTKAAAAAAATAVKVTTTGAEGKPAAAAAPVVVKAAPVVSTKVVSAAASSSSSSSRIVTKPVATIRHIESEEPVPLTATEMAGLNAHHRKGSAAALAAAAAAAAGASGGSGISPRSSSAVDKDSLVTVVSSRRSSNATRHHHHEAAALKFQPGPSVLPNDNVFDFLGETDPDEFLPVKEKKRKRGKKWNMSHPGSHQHPAEKPADEEKTTEEEVDQPETAESDLRATDEDSTTKTPTDEEAEEEEAEEGGEGEGESVEEDAADEEEEAPEDEESEADEANAVEEESDDGVEGAVASEDDREDASDSTGSSPASSSAVSSAPPSRVSSPPAISPTTGLPVQPILKPSAATSPGHGRRVSFMQGGGKKKEAPVAPTKTAKEPEVEPTSEAGLASTAIQATVESVSGVRKRKAKGGAKAAAAAKSLAAAAPSKHQALKEESDEEADDGAEGDVSLVKPPPVSSPFAGLLVLAASFFGARSRWLSARGLSWASYGLGVVVGLLWTVVCVIARVHKQAAHVLSTDHQMAFCFTFLYLFPWLVDRMVYWAPPWAAPCLWYAFLMQVFCTNGAPWLALLFRVLLPLLFLTEGVSHHTFLLELNGAERLVVAFVLASFKTEEYYRPMYLLALALQAITSLVYGGHVLIQWTLLVVSLMAIHERDPSLGPITAAAAAPTTKAKLAATPPTNIDASTAGADAATAGASGVSAAAPSAGGWLSNWLFGGVSGAFHRRPRPKASLAQKARRIGR